MSDDVGFVCPHCTTKIKYTAGMTFGEVMSLRHDKEHLSHKITCLRAENERLREALIDTTASLVASVSLLERGGKKAAPSDKMFAQMLVDYKNSIDRARAALEGVKEQERQS
jgi:hypothetical protein